MERNIEKKLEKMEKDINKKIDESEYRTSTLKGVSNLSRADLETCLMIIDRIKRNISLGMRAMGNTKELFDAYGIDLGHRDWLY